MTLKENYILVTGAAGFIGYHVSKKLIEKKLNVIGLDNLNPYYDVNLKKSRIREISKNINFKYWNFIKGDLTNLNFLRSIFIRYKPEIVINLAAQAGVRYSLKNPQAYIDSNIIGFQNLLTCCSEINVKHLIYASSSSVYGGNIKIPFQEEDSVDHPISLYASTKKSNELMAHTYSHLYNIPTTGLRLFTVYGAWGRPDMAPMIFTKAILNKKPIKIFNRGNMFRDFTYIDDVVEIILKLIKKPPKSNISYDKSRPNPFSSWAPYSIYNLGSSCPVNLLDFINILEKKLGLKAIKQFEDMQPGDVMKTYADITKIRKFTGLSPKTSIEKGIDKFIKWYLSFYSN